ncbi:MAG: molybdopterin-dependent oxidoreductase [Alphaproteobacteria bacterium]
MIGTAPRAGQPVRTTCPYCGVGCGIKATRHADGRVEVRGDESHPVNQGRLCSKGAALAETLGLDGRLLVPEIHGRPASWDAALGTVAAEFRRVIEQHGPDAVAFYVSGQLLTEDYYVANKLMKGFIGSANIDTNSRLCMASTVAGHRRAFGSDTVPGCYEDIDLADLVILVGSNAAWCHPVLYQRMAERRARDRTPRVVVIDPRRTATCESADLHLPLGPGSDVALFSGLLVHLADTGKMDAAFVETKTSGLAETLAAARSTVPTIDVAAKTCGLAPGDVHQFYQWFATTDRTVTLFSQGVNQSSAGTDKVNAILNCHLATGRIGRPGSTPFSLTGQPNAMGGREVGGLANQLAAHMDIGNAAHRDLVQRFWKSPHLAGTEGLKAVDLFNAIGRGTVKAVWIMSTNPAVSLPDSERVRSALAACPFVVVSDCERDTDTNRFAHVLLPAAAWGEKAGTVTNSERRLSRQRGFLPVPGEARPDWWIICEVAKRMGYADAFAYDGPAMIFREHAALSGAGNGGARAFDISALADIDGDGYEAMEPVQWPLTAAGSGGTPRLFGDGLFCTPDHRARFVPVASRPPRYAAGGQFPLVLNTGRMRDQWHTMTRTGRSARLGVHAVEPTIDIHPADAAARTLSDGALARVSSRWGSMVARIRITEAQNQGSVFAPIHWTDRFAPMGRVGVAVNPACDPVSGQPECKHTPVDVAAYQAAWYGFALSRQPVAIVGVTWWAMAKAAGHYRYELAGEAPVPDWDFWARSMLGETDGSGEWVAYRDPTRGLYRFAALRDGRLSGCLFVGRDPSLVSRTWLAGLFGRGTLASADRTGLLAGMPAQADADTGPTVCACFGVGARDLRAAIAERRLETVEAVGAALRAGTNCGSCKPEIAAILRSQITGSGAARANDRLPARAV